MPEPHYTLILEIKKTSHPAPPSKSSSWSDRQAEQPAPSREVDDVARLVLRDVTLGALVEKAAKHLALIEES